MKYENHGVACVADQASDTVFPGVDYVAGVTVVVGAAFVAGLSGVVRVADVIDVVGVDAIVSVFGVSTDKVMNILSYFKVDIKTNRIRFLEDRIFYPKVMNRNSNMECSDITLIIELVGDIYNFDLTVHW